MTGSIALDVVIGLVFVYSIYSLLTTTLVEIVATFIRLRATFLEYGIQRMLNDEGKNKLNLSKDFFSQPLIKYLGSGSLWGLVKKPSYISAQNFSKALLEILKEVGEKKKDINPSSPAQGKVQAGLTDPEGSLFNSDTGKFLRTLLDDSQNDLEKFKALLERWYDDTMERVTSWYKKWTQLITFIVGFLVAFAFNIDTPKIVNKLSHDSKAREQYVSMAQKLVEDKEFVKQVYRQDSLKAYDSLKKTLDAVRKEAMVANQVLSIERAKDKCGKTVFLTLDGFIGWLITAMALSLGAPFWFDLLNKLMRLRGSVQVASTASNSAPSANEVSKINREG